MRLRLLLIAGLLVAALSACAPKIYTPTPTKTPPGPPSQAPTAIPTLVQTTAAPTTPAITVVPTSAVTETSAPPAVASGTLTNTPEPPTPDPSLPAEHYFMRRPIGEGGVEDYADRTYAYGATAGGQYRPHTGEEFRNPSGTPVIAVGNGTIFYAGNDLQTLFGPDTAFYGQLIVLQMTDFTQNGQPVFAVYGHVDTIDVEAGQSVATGDPLGTVGQRGVAIGPHLHFEVRVGDPYSYATSTRNPDLWIRPYFGYGTLAGRVVDSNGALLRGVGITVKGSDLTRYTWSYGGDENIPDEQWKENFTLGDLPEGWHTVTTRGGSKIFSAEIYIRKGHTTWLEIQLP